MMLTAFIYDSDMPGTGPIAVLAGWIAPTKKWADFSDDWQRLVLEVPSPAVRVFKPNASCWKHDSNQSRLNAALDVIEKHRPLGLVLTMTHQDYQAIRDRRADDPRFKSPYFVALFLLALQVNSYFRTIAPQSGIVLTEKINFVFDIQPGQMGAISDAWGEMYDALPDGVRQTFHRSPPDFRDDAEVLPLQAAHMVAWSARRVAGDLSLGRDPFSFNWPENVKMLDCSVSQAMLDAI